MSRDNAHLLDIAEACRLASSFMEGIDRESFARDLKTQSAVLHQLLVLGEAVKRVSQGFRELHPEIPWKPVAGMRDRLIHGYDEVDLDQVWTTINSDVPALLKQIEPLLPQP